MQETCNDVKRMCLALFAKSFKSQGEKYPKTLHLQLKSYRLLSSEFAARPGPGVHSPTGMHKNIMCENRVVLIQSCSPATAFDGTLRVGFLTPFEKFWKNIFS